MPTWKEVMEKKGLRVKAGKTKIMIRGTGLDLLQSSSKFSCAVCRSTVFNATDASTVCTRSAVGSNV